MLPVMVHPVFVNAVVLATPTSPLVVDLVQVTAGPPRIANLNTAPPDCAAESRAVTSSAPNDATTANFAVSRGRVNMEFLLAVSVKYRAGLAIHFDIGPRSPRLETCRRGRRADITRRDERRLTHSAPEGLAPWVEASASPPSVCLTALWSRNTFAREAPGALRSRLPTSSWPPYSSRVAGSQRSSG